MNVKTRLKTKLSTKFTMKLAEVLCKLWKLKRNKFGNRVNDFDYHITDLRRQYPNSLVYASALGCLPFYCKTLEVDDSIEKTTSIKIGDCNIRYTFEKNINSNQYDNVDYLFVDPRLSMLTNLITQTQIRHNEPKTLRVINLKREDKNVAKLHNK
jgi:hypothetical protein